MPDASELTASPLHALCVYAEPLVAGRRVAVFGDAASGLAERFLELGARLVHVYDPQPVRAEAIARHARRGLAVQPLPAGDLDVRDGAFDVAVVPDIAEVPAPASLLGRVRRLLAHGGVALVRARSTEDGARGRARQGDGPVDYYELYDMVALQFAHVRMVAQIPWSGVALAELGRAGGDPDVTVDTQLVSQPDVPEAFVALGSQEDVHLAEYALVQVPAVRSTEAEVAVVLGSDQADLAAAQLRASLLSEQIEELRAQKSREGAAHADARSAIETELAERLTELQEAEVRAADASVRAERAAAELRGRDDDLARLRDRLALAAKEVEDERRLRSRVELEFAAVQRGVEEAMLEAQERSAEAGRIPELEAAVVELESGARNLARRLSATEEARAALEVALAKTQLELEAACAAAQQTEGDAARTEAAAVRVVELEAEVGALEAEVDALSHGHGAEVEALEASLRDRGKVTQALEVELVRRERIILDLLQVLEETRVGAATADPATAAPVAGSADADGTVGELTLRASQARAERDELRLKLDEAAVEIARREGERVTSAWRIQELEHQIGRLEAEQSELTMTIPPPAFVEREREANDVTVLTQRLTAAEDELELLRQALAQEHEARLRAESGEVRGQA